jgi:sialic acid synthase SpsE/sugar phosphate isomerase/epimerase
VEDSKLVSANEFEIGDFTVGGPRTFIIAEIGNNHNGSVDLAKKLVDEAIVAGVDCVKFQIRNKKALYRTQPGKEGSEDLGVEYTQDLLNKVELTLDEHREIRRYCAERGICYLCTPWDEPSVDVLAEMDVSALKLASADLTNPYLIRKAASLGKPLILSTGMSYEPEIERAVAQVQGLGVPFVILHCNSAYPAPECDIHLNYIRRLKELHPFIGYSGHERGIAISIAAVALGSCVIERHISMDRLMEGPDHAASLEPLEFKAMVDGIRQLELALPWTGPGRQPSQGELLNRENLSKSVIAAREIKTGQIFDEADFRIASPGQGLAPYRLPELVGKKAVRDIAVSDFLYETDLKSEKSQKRKYHFPNFWGVPVRYHDFRNYLDWIEPDLYEFHLSYRDLSLTPETYLEKTDCRRLIVHAPELFENSELLDTVSDDLAYRQRSIDNVKRCVEAAERIRAYFPKADSALIVANVGGFSMDEPFELSRRPVLYDRFVENMSKVDFGSMELIPQNMAPFPWHFGGQRHQNIFMMPEELAEQAKRMNIRYCIDLSHLQMTCNHFKIDFQEAMALLLPHAAHLHVADAAGVNGEGVLIGSGDVKWPQTWEKIKRYPTVSFIPEVWQGHKGHGAGFWNALDFLTKLG